MFRPRSKAQLERARGSLRGLSKEEVAAYELPHESKESDEPVFVRLGEAEEGSWLAEHSEKGQSVDTFVRKHPGPFLGRGKKMLVVPFGPVGFVDVLCKALGSFYGIRVDCGKEVGTARFCQRLRRGAEGQDQVHARDLMHELKAIKSKESSVTAAVGVTVVDLYPRESWNFVFGLAAASAGVGVFSFARYLPDFVSVRDLDHTRAAASGGGARGKDDDKDSLILYRSLKVLLHEVGHLIGMAHCVHFRCLMNGSNHLEEFDGKGLLLCPICLRKALTRCPVTPLQHYSQLLDLITPLGPAFDEDKKAILTRQKHILDNSK